MKFKKNLFFAFFAQIISLASSLFMTLIVSKIISVEQYSYWQLFLFYAGYVGLGLMGINDGIYLRIGGKSYENLKYRDIGAQFKIVVIMELFFSFLVIILSFLVKNNDRAFVVFMTAIYLLFNNITNFLSSILQAVNRTYQFSISVILERTIFFLLLFFFTLKKCISYQSIIIIYIFAKLFALIYSLIYTREFSFQNVKINIEDIKDLFINVKIGIVLLISSLAGSLIIGISRIMIDDFWGVTQFGKVSFALLLTNFFLQFINQIGMVLFPALRTITKEKQLEIYIKIRPILSWILTAILIGYIPICEFLKVWTPNYIDSLKYLTITMLICIYDGKMQLLLSTYMKVLRKERQLMIINCIMLILSFITCYTATYILNDFILLLIVMTFSVGLRSMVTELYVNRILSINHNKYIIFENLLSLVFVFSTYCIGGIESLMLYTFLYLFYLFCCKKELRDLKQFIIKH